ncbi:hypothetical protein POTOM_010663 [Populus tomentosa]|uniref:Uncharacterized protein n=1 Tax=Populus tomentosa TaxID=118781 RepID=A0A8X8AAT2_POPTO|nr:hypothetical protein POTOM_010663 [Populus tomentosa]
MYQYWILVIRNGLSLNAWDETRFTFLACITSHLLLPSSAARHFQNAVADSVWSAARTEKEEEILMDSTSPQHRLCNKGKDIESFNGVDVQDDD